MSTANHVQSIIKTENVFVCKNVHILRFMRSAFQRVGVYENVHVCKIERWAAACRFVIHAARLNIIYFVIKSCIRAPFHMCIVHTEIL